MTSSIFNLIAAAMFTISVMMLLMGMEEATIAALYAIYLRVTAIYYKEKP